MRPTGAVCENEAGVSRSICGVVVSKLRLTLACWDYDRTRPILDGTVEAEGVEIAGVVMEPGKLFARMWKTREFDVSEMSLADYTIMSGRGESPFIAIPVFPSRMFRHSCIYVNTKAGIQSAADLAGKRIGSPNYQMTAAVWARAMLHHDHGVLPESVEGHWGGQEAPGGSARIALDLPAGFSVSPIADDKTLSGMLEAGELDALITPNFPSPFLAGSPNVARLFPEFRSIEEDYYRRTRIFPIMHTIVLRREVYEANPWAALSLFEAFVEAKRLAYGELYETDALKITLPWAVSEVEAMRALMGEDFWPYGVAANREQLETFGTCLVEQGLLPKPPAVADLFAPNVLDT